MPVHTDYIDPIIASLNAHKDEWARLSIPAKVQLLQQMAKTTDIVAERWVAAAIKAKGIPSDSPAVGEEWISGPWALLHGFNQLSHSLKALAKGHPRRMKSMRSRQDGQLIVDIFPLTTLDRVVLSGFSGEVWMQPGVTADNLYDNMAGFYRQPNPTGTTWLVLGAGNIASIAPLDVLNKAFAQGGVVLLKPNPVNEYLGEFLTEIFAPMIEAGYMAIVYGGADVGEYLTQHDGIDAIHITGSATTLDRILYGSDEQAEERRQRRQPRTSKKISSELGAVSPTIVVPGPWTEADLRFQAEHIATQKFHNAGFNCVASQVLVLPESWEHSERLLEMMREVIRTVPARTPYYPGAELRQQQILAAHPNAERFDPDHASVPRTLITGLDAANPDEICFRQECFVGLLAQTSLPGSSPLEYLKNAIDFANETLVGNLGANIIIHPRTLKEMGAGWEDSIAELRYGAIGVNAWAGSAFLITQCPWGAYPENSLENIRSGIGFVHNTMLFDRPQKTVVYGPFAPFPRSLMLGEVHAAPKPAWFVRHPHGATLGRLFARYEANPGWSHIPRMIAYAIRA